MPVLKAVLNARLIKLLLGTGSAPLVPETMRRLIELAADDAIAPVIDRELPLEQASEAHRAIEARETFGKVVLRP